MMPFQTYKKEEPEKSKLTAIDKINIVAILLVLFLLALAFFLTPPASAQTITMSNPGSMSQRDIAVYYPNGTMQGFWNSTSVITLDANESYIFAMKPIQTNPFDDPTDWLVNGVFPTITSNAFAILLLAYIFLTRR